MADVDPSPVVGDRVYAWPVKDEPWPECGTVLAIEGEDVTVKWDHLDVPVVHHDYLPHLTFIHATATS